MLYLSLFIFPFPFVLVCSIQLIVTKPTSSLVAHPCCLLSRSYFSLFFLFFFYSHSTRCSFPLHIVTWIHIIGLSVGELSSRSVTILVVGIGRNPSTRPATYKLRVICKRSSCMCMIIKLIQNSY